MQGPCHEMVLMFINKKLYKLQIKCPFVRVVQLLCYDLSVDRFFIAAIVWFTFNQTNGIQPPFVYEYLVNESHQTKGIQPPFVCMMFGQLTLDQRKGARWT